MNTYVITDLPSSPLGMTIKFRVVATNLAGHSVTSNTLSVKIASPPDTPSSAPSSDLTTTSSNLIRIIYSEPYNGGSTITNYEI